MKVDAKKLQVFLPDTRGVTISRFGKGNLKIGLNVVTYSKLAIYNCPGSTSACREFCYATRIDGLVREVHATNSQHGADVPDLPEGTELVRMHISGDFDSVEYIRRWIEIVASNPEVTFWAYTRSWRVPDLLPHLEELQSLFNMQLFASMDESTTEAPPEGWRRAWIQGDSRASGLICPEERGKVQDCEHCGWCFKQLFKDVIFLKH